MKTSFSTQFYMYLIFGTSKYHNTTRSMAVGFGAMTADFILMIIITVFGSVLDLKSYDRYIYVLGAIFFLYLKF